LVEKMASQNAGQRVFEDIYFKILIFTRLLAKLCNEIGAINRKKNPFP
jgi:hypothetical protein